MAAAGRDPDLPGVAHDLLAPRHVLVGPVVLLRQHGDVFALHPFERQRLGGHRSKLLVDRQPVLLPRAAALDEREVAVRFDAHQVRRTGDDGAVLRRHAAPAFRFERAGENIEPVCPPVKRPRSGRNVAVPLSSVTAAGRLSWNGSSSDSPTWKRWSGYRANLGSTGVRLISASTRRPPAGSPNRWATTAEASPRPVSAIPPRALAQVEPHLHSVRLELLHLERRAAE